MTLPTAIHKTAVYNYSRHTVHDWSRHGRSLCGLVTPINPPWPWEGTKPVTWNEGGMKDVVLLRGVRMDDFPTAQQCDGCRYIIQNQTKAFAASNNREYWETKEAVPV